jgi:hypothetical protein
MEKEDVVVGFVEVPTAQEEAFWKLYYEYESKRQSLGQERIVLLSQYIDDYETMGIEEAAA